MSAGESLRRLDALLQEGDAEAELLLVGGAVLDVVFRHAPESRRPSLLFGDPAVLANAAAAVASEAGLHPEWLSAAARGLIGEHGEWYSWRGRRLAVFAPRPAYAMALKCAELRVASGERRKGVEADLRYLVRLLDLRTADDVLAEAGRYFTPRYLGPEAEVWIQALLA